MKENFANLRTVRSTPEASDSNSRILGRYRTPQIPIGEAVRVRPKSNHPDDPPPDRPDDAPRDRHFRFRQRRKASKAVAPIEFDGAVLDWLVRLGWLLESEACDRAAVGSAVSRMLAASARR